MNTSSSAELPKGDLVGELFLYEELFLIYVRNGWMSSGGRGSSDCRVFEN